MADHTCFLSNTYSSLALTQPCAITGFTSQRAHIPTLNAVPLVITAARLPLLVYAVSCVIAKPSSRDAARSINQTSSYCDSVTERNARYWNYWGLRGGKARRGLKILNIFYFIFCFELPSCSGIFKRHFLTERLNAESNISCCRIAKDWRFWLRGSQSLGGTCVSKWHHCFHGAVHFIFWGMVAFMFVNLYRNNGWAS